jgi:hypothetical protein
MRRHRHACEVLEGRVAPGIQTIHKEIFDHRGTEFSGGQRNTMYDHQTDVVRIRPWIPVRGVPLSGSSETMIVGYMHLFSRVRGRQRLYLSAIRP